MAVFEADLCDWIWQGLMKSVDWSARQDQMDNMVVQYITVGLLVNLLDSSSRLVAPFRHFSVHAVTLRPWIISDTRTHPRSFL